MTTAVNLRKHTFFRPAILSLGMLLTLTACSSNNKTDDNPADTDFVTYSITADGSQEIPASGSSATATGTLTLNEATGILSGSVNTVGITASNAHIHEAYSGKNGDILIPLDIEGDTLSVPENTILTAQQQSVLAAGGYYLNIHSADFPAGEIRDQLAPAGVSVLQVTLDGGNEVPAVESAGSGTAYITVNETTGAAVINVTTSGLTTPNAAHIHGAFAGSNGSVLQALVQDTAEIGNFSSSEGLILSSDELESLNSGAIYVNVHSAESPSGELRGQILPSGISLLTALLSGDQEVPEVTTAAAGNGVVTLNENTNTLNAIVNVTGAPTANAGHIHEAAAGSNGGVLIALTQSADDVGVFEAIAQPVTAAQIETLKNEGMYFNIHTTENPSGEIRGQIKP